MTKEMRIEIGCTDRGLEYVLAVEPHSRYGYETPAGERFALWDARRERGRVPVLADAPDGAPGRLGAMTAVGDPDGWRKLRVGVDRVLVEMTPQLARAEAIAIVDMALAHPDDAAKVRRAWPSREAAIDDIAGDVLDSGIAAVATVTAGLLRAFELDAGDVVLDVPDVANAEHFDQWSAGANDVPGQRVKVPASFRDLGLDPPDAPDAPDALDMSSVGVVLELRYRARDGGEMTEGEWTAAQRDPAYAVVRRDTARPAAATEPFAFELMTHWTGITVCGDTRGMYRTGCRLIHDCGRPECVSGRFQLMTTWHTEAEAIEGHATIRQQVIADVSGDGARACHQLAAWLREQGLDHLPAGADAFAELRAERTRARRGVA